MGSHYRLINHIYKQIHIMTLQRVNKIKNATYVGAKTPFTEILKYARFRLPKDGTTETHRIYLNLCNPII